MEAWTAQLRPGDNRSEFIPAGWLSQAQQSGTIVQAREEESVNPVFLVLTGSVTHLTAETKCSWGEFTSGLVSWHIKERLKRLKALWSLKPRKQYKLRACYSWKYSEVQVCCYTIAWHFWNRRGLRYSRKQALVQWVKYVQGIYLCVNGAEAQMPRPR